MAAQTRVHIYHGPDVFSAREAIHALREQLGVSGENVVRLDDKATLNDIAAAAQSASFFAEPRLVIIEDITKRFGGRRRGGGGRAGRGRSPAQPAESELDQLAELFANLPETTTVVVLDAAPPAAFLEAMKGVAKATVFPILRSSELRRFADARLKAQGGSASPQAMERLCEMFDGYHVGELAQEVDKLVTFAGGRRIELSDVEEMGTGAIQLQTWDLTDAVLEGRADRALRALQRMDEKNQPPQLLHAMLVRQYRHVLVAQAMLREGFGAAQIGQRLGIASQYPLQKAIDQASRHPAEGLEKAYRRLLESDAAIKTGIMDIDTALELLIVELAEIGNSGRRRPAQAGYGRR